MSHYTVIPRLLGHLAALAFEWATAAATAWIRWFWRLSVGPKVIALAAQIIVLYLTVSWLSLGASGFQLLGFVSVGLAILAVASLLFGPQGRRGV